MSLDLADIKPSVVNWMMVGLMALTFIVVGKWIMTKWPIPGLSTLFLAA